MKIRADQEYLTDYSKLNLIIIKSFPKKKLNYQKSEELERTFIIYF